LANPPLKLRWAIFLGIALLTLAIRLPRLGERPMHTDEAVNGYITGQLLAGETYQYDPQDRHGPALYLAALPIVRSAGAKNLAELSEQTVRLVPVIWGTLTILLFAAAASQIGFSTAVVAALLFAIAPLSVYYNRYFIHETLFVATTFALLLSGWRMLETKSWRAAIAVGGSAGLMLACKETALLHFAALVPAVLWWLFKRRGVQTHQGLRGQALFKLALIASATFALIVWTLYTWGGKHWSGPLDLMRSLPRFASRAAGEGHEKPFLYYLSLLGYDLSGCLVLGLAVMGSVVAIRGQRTESRSDQPLFIQSLLIYGAAISLIYSVIPYKTPWIALNLWLPIALLAGVGVTAVWRKFQNLGARAFLVLFIGTLFLALGHASWKWAFVRPADERNPYAYAHTGEDLLRLPERLNQLIANRALPSDPTIAVVMKDAWPLPWYLRHFAKTGFWQPNQKPNQADVYITSPEAGEALADELKNFRPEFFGVRPEILILLWTPQPSQTP
jgi:uncharacterized protein (TIGR03663 family)